MSERKEAGPGLPHLVAIAVFDGVEMLDVAGPMQVFGTAERVGRGSADYEVVLVAARRGFVRTSVGVPLVAERSWHDLGPEVGTLLVPGGLVVGAGGVRPLIDPELVESGGVARRIASVCTGAHIAAAAGLFDGRRATTHWSTADVLASEHPEVEVVADAIFVEDGPVWSSAGVSAGIDLALALVAADHGDDLARRVAQWMVVYLRRPGGQQQFSAYLGPPRQRLPTSPRPAVPRRGGKHTGGRGRTYAHPGRGRTAGSHRRSAADGGGEVGFRIRGGAPPQLRPPSRSESGRVPPSVHGPPARSGRHNGSQRVSGTGTYRGGHPSRRGLSPGSAAA
ncbi:putative intracellular protease/amidase [Rhodococcus sp. BE178]